MLVTMAVVAVCLAGPPTLQDDFDDNALGGLWAPFNENASILAVAEQNQRLEFPADATGDAAACCSIVQSGVIGDGWALDWSQDFQTRIAFRVDLPVAPAPDLPSAHVSLDFVFAGDGATVSQGARFVFGSFIRTPGVFFDPAVSLIRLDSGVLLIDTLDAAPPAVTGTLYLGYTAATDTLSISFGGFNDPVAASVTGWRGAYGFSRALVVLRGVGQFFDGEYRTTYDGLALHLDDFVIENGTVIDTSCLADTDGSGEIDVIELLGILSAWSTDDATYDIAPAPQGDGIVDVLDLLGLLSSWGPCS